MQDDDGTKSSFYVKHRTISSIINKLKAKLEIKTDVDLAVVLGMKHNTFVARKKRNSIPYEEIINLCEERGISIASIFEDEPNSALSSDETDNNKTENGRWKRISILVADKLADDEIQPDAKKFISTINFIDQNVPRNADSELLAKIATEAYELAFK